MAVTRKPKRIIKIEELRSPKLLDHVDIDPLTGCWNWKYRKDTRPGRGKGRAVMSVKGRYTNVARVVWEQNVGSIPRGKFVLHRCDNPSCINPACLWLGTQADNLADMVRKGRDRKARGEAHCNAKLTDDKVREICKRYRNGGVSQRELAKEYSVDSANICLIVNRQAWKHVRTRRPR